MHPTQVLNTDSREVRNENIIVRTVTADERCKNDRVDKISERKKPSIAAKRFGSKSIAFAFQ